jgi:hypothetical protein
VGWFLAAEYLFPLESTTCRDLPRLAPGPAEPTETIGLTRFTHPPLTTAARCAIARRGLNGFNSLRRIPNFGAVWVKPGQRLLTANGINGVKFCCRPIGARAMARASVQSPYSAPARGQGGIGQAPYASLELVYGAQIKTAPGRQAPLNRSIVGHASARGGCSRTCPNTLRGIARYGRRSP